MKELYDKTKEFLQDIYTGELNDEVLDILTVSVMALYGRFSEASIELLPKALNKLTIQFGKEEIFDMVCTKFPEYPKDELNKDDSTFITRAMSLNDDNVFDEDWVMFISTKNIATNLVNLIGRATHELIHLLRFNEIVDGEKESKIRDGVSIARCNKETKTLKRKHYNMEEGIVETFTIRAMETLYEFVSEYDVSFSPALSAVKNDYKTKFDPSYQVERFFLDGLTRDKKFDELLEYSFLDESDPLSLVTYYNNTVGDPSGFTRLSRGIDRVVDYAHNEDEMNFKKSTQEIISEINAFLAKKKY